MKNKKLSMACLAVLLSMPLASLAQDGNGKGVNNINGKKIFLARCAMCHGSDIKASEEQPAHS